MPATVMSSWLVLECHPQLPEEVPVVCKHLTGMLQLCPAGSHLSIKLTGPGCHGTVSPPELEAMLGLTHDWKVHCCLLPMIYMNRPCLSAKLDST